MDFTWQALSCKESPMHPSPLHLLRLTVWPFPQDSDMVSSYLFQKSPLFKEKLRKFAKIIRIVIRGKEQSSCSGFPRYATFFFH